MVPDRPSLPATAPSRLVFVHGWGFDGHVWDEVRARLEQPGSAIDLGYAVGGSRAGEGGGQGVGGDGMDAAAVPEGQRIIGVGHSLGGLWLLRHLRGELAGLILINGFARFLAAPDWPHGQSPRYLARMQRVFAARPRVVLDEFRQRCGAPPWQGEANVVRLASDLDVLGQGDARAAMAGLALPCLCLGAEDDPLVSVASTLATAALAGATCGMVHQGGHLLPVSQPAWCARQIAGFVS